jgi:broad specificity phosphatase PhoE
MCLVDQTLLFDTVLYDNRMPFKAILSHMIGRAMFYLHSFDQAPKKQYARYLMRHEKRDHDVSFGASLSYEGLQNAEHAVPERLACLNIERVYCSPFLRTLQTIAPYCLEDDHMICPEWALSESIPNHPIPFHQFDDLINHKYQSVANAVNLTNDESILPREIMKQRVQAFWKTLPDKDVLLVTHLPVINVILSMRDGIEIPLYKDRPTGTVIVY